MCHDQCPRPISGGDDLTELQTQIPLVRGQIPAFIASPSGAAAPAVLLLHDTNGPNDFYRDLARRLALAGYVTVLPDLFHRQPPLADDSREAKSDRMQATEQSHTLDDIESALIWLRDNESTTGAIATIGFCMGGTLALLGTARYPAPHATVAYYGFPHRQRTPTAPILPLDEDEVAGIQSPLLAFWGTEDAGVGMNNVAAYDNALTRYDKAHEFVIYNSRPHGFLTFDEASPNFADAADSWRRTLAFLDRNLRGEAPS